MAGKQAKTTLWEWLFFVIFLSPPPPTDGRRGWGSCLRLRPVVAAAVALLAVARGVATRGHAAPGRDLAVGGAAIATLRHRGTEVFDIDRVALVLGRERARFGHEVLLVMLPRGSGLIVPLLGAGVLNG